MKYCGDCINLISSSVQHPDTIPYTTFHRVKPQFNSDPAKAFLPFGAMCLIKHTEGQRAALASKMDLNIHHVPKVCIGVNLGFNDHHPGNNIFFTHPSATPLIRDNYEVVSLIPFDWKPKPVHQQTYTTNINPSYQDILRRNDFSQPDQTIDQTSTSSTDTPAESADSPASESAQTTFSELSTVDFLVSDPVLQSASDLFDPRPGNSHSNPDSTSAQISPNLLPPPSTHRYPIHTHRTPSHLACNLSTLPETTKTSLFLSNSEETEFSIKKGLLMTDYKHAVEPALNKELTKMFVTYNALVLIDRSEVPPDATFCQFFCFLKKECLHVTMERKSLRPLLMPRSRICCSLSVPSSQQPSKVASRTK
jgi:hypothetical protein